MTSWRQKLSVLILCGASAIAGVAGFNLVRDVQFARAEKEVEVTREQLSKAEDLSTVFRQVGKVVSPSVVNINVKKTVKGTHHPDLGPFRHLFPPNEVPDLPDTPDDGNDEEMGTGSGVIVEIDGKTAYVITNNHVAGDAESMDITLADGRKITNAKLVGADPKSDLAVVKIEAEHLIAAKWGDSDQLQKGDWVLAFGSPFGYVGSMTHGIVSALNRQAHILGDMGYENFIQVDAPINPGNSGGPLVNLKGEVVGINTAIASRSGGFQGIGFAIPSDQAQVIYKQLKEKGKIVRGWLGIGIKDVDARLAKTFNYDQSSGVLVDQAFPGTPASGKLLHGDIISAMDGKPVTDVQHLRQAIAITPPGTEVKLTVFRDGKSQEVIVKIGEQPDEMTAAGPRFGHNTPGHPDVGAEALGLRMTTLTSDMAERLGLTEVKGGALITEVTAHSPAAEAELRAGDVITEVGRTPVTTAQEASDALNKADLSKDVRLYVVSREGSRYVLIHK